MKKRFFLFGLPCLGFQMPRVKEENNIIIFIDIVDDDQEQLVNEFLDGVCWPVKRENDKKNEKRIIQPGRRIPFVRVHTTTNEVKRYEIDAIKWKTKTKQRYADI